MICNACPRKCNTDRNDKTGYCNSPEEFRVSRAALHFWEEPCISSKNGSGTVFFSGCNLRCVFCQNHEISHENKGMIVSDKKLTEIFENLINQGAENINLVNPTHYAKRLSKLLKEWKSPVPVVYNSSGYESVETLKNLEGLVDIYLPDFKYIRPDKAARYSKAKNYPNIALAALKEMRRQQRYDVFDKNGVMKKGMIIRHLVLPANTNSSVEIIDYLSNHFKDTYLSIMSQYIPCGDLSGYSEINRKITKREYDKVVDYAVNSGLKNVFIQELSSAQKDYIPQFDFTGIL